MMNLITPIFDFFVWLISLAIKYWYVTLTLIVLAVGCWLWNGWSNAEKKAETAVATDNQIRVDETKTNANVAANTANQAVGNVKAVENANFANTNLTEANRLRCRAFPERCR